jgi:chromosome segregation ATPase
VERNIDPLLVPIPTQMPEKPNLDGVPSAILRSGAVEALLNQNDDLMARLSVALRRASQMEEELQEIEKQKRIWDHQADVLRDKLLLVQEKERLHQQRDQKFENEITRLREELRLAETRYVELYSTSKDRTKTLLERIESHARRISRLLKFKERVHVAGKSLKQQHIQLRKQFSSVQFLLAQQDVRCEDLQRRVDELTGYIQNQGHIYSKEKSELVEIYETKLAESNKRAAESVQQVQKLQGQLQTFDVTMDQNTLLKNQLISEQRAKEEVTQRLNESVAHLQAQLANVSSQCKGQIIELDRQANEIMDMKTVLSDLAKEKSRLLDQIETVQILWTDSQKQIEQKNARIESLQKLNQQLSISLNQFRKENEQTKAQLQNVGFITQNRLEALKGQFMQAHLEPELGQRIDVLLAEMQKGFSTQAPAPREDSETPLSIK